MDIPWGGYCPCEILFLRWRILLLWGLALLRRSTVESVGTLLLLWRRILLRRRILILSYCDTGGKSAAKKVPKAIEIFCLFASYLPYLLIDATGSH